MYRKNNKEQLTIEDFFLPFGGKLDTNNRWVKLAEITPWDHIEEYYLQSMSQETAGCNPYQNYVWSSQPTTVRKNKR